MVFEPLVVAVSATDFPGIKAKPLVQDGDSVRTGDPLFFDKRHPDTAFLSPATGTVTKVVFGERRALQRVEVTPAEADDFADIAHVPVEEIGSTSREELVLAIKRAGLWPLLRERPVGRIADGQKRPAAIYINGMDTEPLAADPAYAVTGQQDLLQAGVYLLDALTPGPVYLTVRADEVASDLLHLKGVEFHAFDEDVKPVEYTFGTPGQKGFQVTWSRYGAAVKLIALNDHYVSPEARQRATTSKMLALMWNGSSCGAWKSDLRTDRFQLWPSRPRCPALTCWLPRWPVTRRLRPK